MSNLNEKKEMRLDNLAVHYWEPSLDEVDHLETYIVVTHPMDDNVVMGLIKMDPPVDVLHPASTNPGEVEASKRWFELTNKEDVYVLEHEKKAFDAHYKKEMTEVYKHFPETERAVRLALAEAEKKNAEGLLFNSNDEDHEEKVENFDDSNGDFETVHSLISLYSDSENIVDRLHLSVIESEIEKALREKYPSHFYVQQ